MESFWRIGHRVGGGAVGNVVALLYDECAEPSVLALVVLHILARLTGLGHINWQYLILQQSGASQQ